MTYVRDLVHILEAILRYKEIQPAIQSETRQRLIERCNDYLEGRSDEPHFLGDLVSALGWQSGTVHQAIAAVQATVAALKDANSICRSAYAIAQRKGCNTNWDSFVGSVQASLERQHKVMFPVDSHRTVDVVTDNWSQHQTMSVDELTEAFYAMRDQRARLLRFCEKALAAYDAALETGKGDWSGQDIAKLREAVAVCRPEDRR